MCAIFSMQQYILACTVWLYNQEYFEKLHFYKVNLLHILVRLLFNNHALPVGLDMYWDRTIENWASYITVVPFLLFIIRENS